MAIPVLGSFYSDLAVGAKMSVSEDLLDLIPGQTPFLNTTGFGGPGEKPKQIVHNYIDESYVPLRTTLVGNIGAGVVNITLGAAIAKPGQRIEIDGELIELGASANNLLFVGCTRSVGTAAPAAHLNGARVLIVGRPEVQGAPAGAADIAMEPRGVTTYVQEFERVIEVPDVVDAAEYHGRPGRPFDWKAVEMMRDVKLELEHSGIWGAARVPVGTTGVSGAFDGVVERVIGTNTTAMGGGDFTQAILRESVEGIADSYDPDADVNAVLLCPIRQSFIFSDWQQAHIEVPPGDPLVQTYGVQVRRLRIGPMLIDVIPVNRMHTAAVLYQPNFIKWKTYIPLTLHLESKTGRRQRGFIAGAYVVEVYCPEAHWVFTGLAT
jgi:hypothetical protein